MRGLLIVAIMFAALPAQADFFSSGGGGCAPSTPCLPGQITVNGATGITNPGDINITGAFRVNGTPLTGTGTVTSVAETFTGGLISVTGSPINGAGTLALTVSGTSGGIPYFSGAATWASSGVLAANGLVIGGGAGVAPASIATGNSGILVTSAGGVPSISSTLPTGLAMGTPASLVLTNATGLPIATGVSGLGTGVATAFGNAVNTVGGVVTALATPTISSGFGTTPTAPPAGETSVFFQIVIGTGGTANSGVVAFSPAAAHGWSCRVNDDTNSASIDVKSVSTSTSSATFAAYSATTGLAMAFSAGDVLTASCLGG